MLDKIIKLNIGSGEEVINGYTSVDLYDKADVKDSILTLSSFEDNSVDVVRSYHILEHLKMTDVPIAMKTVYRVLKTNGIWDIEVPDLIWLMKDFLQLEDHQRWGWKIQTIFGLQVHDGEYHKSGFSKQHLYDLLHETGFVVKKIEERFCDIHNQGVINAIAFK